MAPRYLSSLCLVPPSASVRIIASARDVRSRSARPANAPAPPARMSSPAPAPSRRLVRLPGDYPLSDGVGARLQAELLAEHGIAVQLPSFDGVGYWRLSAHVYTTAADVEEFAERAIPVILRRLAEPA